MVFVELVTDAFADNFRKQRGSQLPGRTGRAGAARARRPMRGLEIKEDTYGLIKVVQSDGTELELFDSSSETGKSARYTNFILQSVQEARMEKHQIVETFGEAYIFFFGEHPRFLDVTVVLLNSNDFNWEAEFWANYNDYLRGTKLVEMGARTYLFYDDTVVEGYWLQAQAVKTSDQPLSIQVSFRLFLTNYSNVSLVGDPNFPIRSSVNLPPAVDLTTADGFTVARAAVDAAGAAASQDVLALMAAQGAAQQARGFGGGQKLTDALRGGLASNSDISGVLQDAAGAMGDFSASSFRSAPVRGKIVDNFDEFTALPPAPPTPPEEDQDGEMTAVDSLPESAVDQASAYGVDLDGPDTLTSLGLGPTFLTSGGFGLRAGAAGQATFGAVAALQGGVGFTGQSFASAGVQASAEATFAGGVQVGGGISGGVGVAGGVAGGIAGGIDGQLTGAAVFEDGVSGGFGGMGLGASIVVGGAPSAFALIVADGTLDPTGQSETHSVDAFFSADALGFEGGVFVS
jgi:hypothetical protein